MMTGALVYLIVTFFTPQLPVCGQNRNRAPKFENDWFWEIEENAPIGKKGNCFYFQKLHISQPTDISQFVEMF